MLIVLVEGRSDVPIMRALLERRFGLLEDEDFRIYPHEGIGRLPSDPNSAPPAGRRQLLDQLPAKLRGFARSFEKHLPWFAVVVVVDNDGRDCRAFKAELVAMLAALDIAPSVVLFRIALQEIEAWYLADRAAVRAAFPTADLTRLPRAPEAVIAAAERFAAVIGERDALRKRQWAEAMAPHLAFNPPAAPSLTALVFGIERLLRV